MGERDSSGNDNKDFISNKVDKDYFNQDAALTSGASSAVPADYLANTQIHKFPTKGGTGFAAEDANHLFDKFAGRDAVLVGGNNAKNGADRIVEGLPVQTKYFDSAARSVGAGFDDVTGAYRYGDMPLEVPTDQYDDAVRIMSKRIEDGKVPGYTNPDEAEKLVKKGNVTYKQAYNIARAGNIDSLKYDAANGAVVGLHVLAIGFVVSFAKATWEGKTAEDALSSAVVTGLQGAGGTFVTSVVASQLMRTQSARVGTVVIREGVKQVAKTKAGKVTIQAIAEASAGKALHGAAAVNHVSKLLRNNAITGVVTTTVLTAPDVYRAVIEKNTSWAQVGKNLMVNGSGVAAGAAGWMGGAAAGAALGSAVPLLGTAIGGVVGGIAGAIVAGMGGSAASKYVLDQVIEDDATEMQAILRDVLIEISEDYLLSEEEAGKFTDDVLKEVNAELLREMYAKQSRRQFVTLKFEGYAEKIAKARAKVILPPEQQVRKFINDLVEQPSPIELESDEGGRVSSDETDSEIQARVERRLQAEKEFAAIEAQRKEAQLWISGNSDGIFDLHEIVGYSEQQSPAPEENKSSKHISAKELSSEGESSKVPFTLDSDFMAEVAKELPTEDTLAQLSAKIEDLKKKQAVARTAAALRAASEERRMRELMKKIENLR